MPVKWSEAEAAAWRPGKLEAAMKAFWRKFDEYYHGMGLTEATAIEHIRIRHPEIVKDLFWSPEELLAWRRR